MKSTRFKLLAGATGLVIALVALVLLNVLAGAVRLRADLTADRLYTLSPGTRAMLRELQRDVTLKFYFSRSSDAAPIPFKDYGRRILDLLKEYQSESGGRIVLDVLDPQPDSDAEERAQRYGLSATRIDPAGDRPPVYLGLVAISGAKEAVIPFFAPTDEPQLEYYVTRAINEVTLPAKPKIGLFSPLPVMGRMGAFMAMGREEEPWILVQELRSVADVVELSGALDAIPEDISTVLLIHPRNLPETALYALDQFVLRGGRLLAFMDPQCLTELETQSRQFRDPFAVKSDINRLTSAWGITMDTERIVADTRAATRVSMPDGRVDLHRGWLSLRAENFNRDEISLVALDAMQMPFAGWFKVEPKDGLTVTPLIAASPEAGSLSSVEASMGAAMGVSSFRSEPSPVLLALKVSGRFPTAFPHGRPAQNPNPTNESPGASASPPHLREAEREATVILIGDADFAFDGFAARQLPMFGRGVYQLMNDNIHFAANLIGQLAGGDALLGLRSRGSYERPFTRVLALQTAAQERWRQEELKLQEQLRLTQMKIDELQARKSEDQKLILSPEQKREIESFRRQIAETRRQLREVRKNLRRDIEALGMRIKLLNIAGVPALVIGFGLIHGFQRRRRAKS